MVAVCFEVCSPQCRWLIGSSGLLEVLRAQASGFALALCPILPSEDQEKVGEV